MTKYLSGGLFAIAAVWAGAPLLPLPEAQADGQRYAAIAGVFHTDVFTVHDARTVDPPIYAATK